MNLRNLYEHIDADARRALANAAEDTAREAHRGITIERYLLSLIRDRHIAPRLMSALDRAGLDAPAIETALAGLVSMQPKAASPDMRPAFTESLRSLLRDTWALSYDEYGEETVTPVRFFETVARRGDQWPRLVEALPGFARVDVATLASLARSNPRRGLEPSSEDPIAEDAAAGDLARFGYDIGKLAREGGLDPVVGCRDPMRAAAAILLRRAQNSAVIVGESGVGKSACALGLVGAIARRSEPAPKALHGTAVWALDVAAIRAGATMRGALEERLQNVARELDGTDTVLFVDDLHMLMESGSSAGVDALRAMLSQRSVRLLATCGWREWRRHIEPDPGLARRLAAVRMAEPDDAASVAIVEGLRHRLAEHHNVEISEEAIGSAVALSRRYIAARRLPDKAVATLDSACARARMDLAPAPGGAGPDGEAAAQSAPAPSPSSLTPSITAPSITAASITAPSITVGVEHVAQVVADLTGVPVGSMLTDVGRTAASLEPTLRERVVGQDAALARCATQARAYLAGLSDRRRPVGALMLCGPSGTGKTETAHALADALFGGRLLNVNMSEYQEAHTVSGLKGAPAGYVGYGEGGRLTEGIRRTPYCVVLLDEIEKAHGDVIEMLYQVLDKGWMEDAEGLEADFSNALIILTTNAGDTIVEAAAKKAERPAPDEMHTHLTASLGSHFPAAFLGRLQIIPYWPLEDATLASIARMRLARLGEAYRASHSRDLLFHETVHEWLASRVRTTPQGARFLDGIIARSIRPAVADYVLGELAEDRGPEDVEVAMEAGQLVLREPFDPDAHDAPLEIDSVTAEVVSVIEAGDAGEPEGPGAASDPSRASRVDVAGLDPVPGDAPG